ncbi:Uncharacterised protein [Candidatus Anstonella stagnisolia]|nr:Uncharacterised protein [Candidatus Anstonella stagnisolia]
MNEEKIDREKSLKDGFFDLRVQRSGVYQQLRFKIVREKSAAGSIPFIVPDRIIDLPELLRICNAAQLPLKSATGVLVPKGKMLHDFAGL